MVVKRVHENIIIIGDRHASSETHQRPTCLIRDPSETDIFHRRPTCLIVDPSVSDKACWSPIRHIVLR